MKRIFIFSFFILGFSSLVSQVVVIREFASSFYGNEFFIGWVFFVWLLATSLGAFSVKKVTASREGLLRIWQICHGLIAILFLAALILVRSGKLILGTPPGAAVDLVAALGFSFLILAPLCLVLGFQFALAVQCWGRAQSGTSRDSILGRSYFYETLGFIAGGVLFSFILIFANEFKVAAGLILLNFLAAGALGCSAERPSRWTTWVFFILAIIISAGLFWKAPRLNAQTAQWRFPSETLIATENTLHGNIAVTRTGEQYNFYQNGLLLGSGDERFAGECLVHFPMLFHSQPKKVLLIGTGFNGPLREVLKHDPEAVCDVELDSRQISLARKFLSPELQNVLEDKRVEIRLADSRSFLRQDPRVFDVIIVNTPNPSTVLMNRQYTAEFFRALKQHLTPEGVMAIRLGFAANFVTSELESLAASIYKTLKDSFAHVAVLPEDTLYLVASQAPLTADPVLLARRFETRGLQNGFITRDYLKYRLTNDRVAQVSRVLEQNVNARLNRDLEPRGYYYEFLRWLSSFHLSFSRALGSFLKVPFVTLPVILILGIFLWRFPMRRPLAGLAMAAGGFSLMTGEIILIYGYQVFYGNLYYRLSWIITAFMAGMGAGTWIANRLEAHLGEPRRVLARVHWGAGLFFALFAGLAWAVSENISRVLGAGEILFLTGAVIVGSLVGFEFPVAVRLASAENPRSSAGTIYGADLLGSCAGALLAAGFLIPIWGVYTALILLVILNTTVAICLCPKR